MKKENRRMLGLGLLAVALSIGWLSVRTRQSSVISWSPAAAPGRLRAAVERAQQETAKNSLPVEKSGGTRPILDRLAAGMESILHLEAGDFLGEFARVQALTTVEEREILTKLLLRKWGQTDHDGAFAAVASLGRTNPENRAKLDQYVVDGWALTDPDAAWATAVAGWNERTPPVTGGSRTADLENRNGPYGAGRMTGIAKALVEAGRHETAAELIERSPQDAAGSAAATVALAWGQRDLEAAKEWALGLKGNTHYNAVRTLSTLMVQRDREEAARYLERTSIHPESRREMLMSPQEMLAERKKMISDAAAKAAARDVGK